MGLPHTADDSTDALPVHYVFPRAELDPAAAAQELVALARKEGDLGASAGVVWDVSYDWKADEIEGAFRAALPETALEFARINRPSLVGARKELPADAPAGRTGCCSTEAPKEGCCSAEKPANGCCADTPADACCSADKPAGGCCAAPAEGDDADAAAQCEDEASGSVTSGAVPAAVPLARAQSAALPALRRVRPGALLFYLGPDSRSLMNLQMEHSSVPLLAYDAASGARVLTGASRQLSRRLYAVHQAMASDVFGLVVGNVGLKSSQPLVQTLRDELRAHQKKSYTLSVGRLNPAKLANFAEIDCFVLIGCAEGGVVDNPKDFLKPIVTPHEALLALRGSDWDPSRWTLDIDTVLQEAKDGRDGKDGKEGDADGEGKKGAESEAREKDLDFDLISGTYRVKRTFVEKEADLVQGTQDLTLRNQQWSLANLESSAGSLFLQNRSFQGLEPRYGQDEPSTLEQGRSGIARGYTEEKDERHREI